MRTLIESNLKEGEGTYPHSISLNETGGELHPFSTHVKIYAEQGDENHFFESGDYCSTLKEALHSFEERCKDGNFNY
jgi:hypothetical protein